MFTACASCFSQVVVSQPSTWSLPPMVVAREKRLSSTTAASWLELQRAGLRSASPSASSDSRWPPVPMLTDDRCQ